MKVLSWPHRRHILVISLAELDAQVASRVDTLEKSWSDKYRLSPHQVGLESAVEETVSGHLPPHSPPPPTPRPYPATAQTNAPAEERDRALDGAPDLSANPVQQTPRTLARARVLAPTKPKGRDDATPPVPDYLL
jgi:hypothetical protein